VAGGIARGDYLERCASQRTGPEFASGDRKACYGILPESVSHEGYLAQPVHAYWDDFWALRGSATGPSGACARRRRRRATTLRAADDLHRCLYASIEATIAQRGLAYVPGSVEWADFDVTATATALTTTDAAECLPPSALVYTYDEYLRGFRSRRDGTLDWNNYTAYEIRISARWYASGAWTRRTSCSTSSGRPAPACVNQWPEISCVIRAAPVIFGDVPHSWIGAEWVLAVLSLFAYEHPTKRVAGARGRRSPRMARRRAEIAIEDLPTWYGRLSYTLARVGDDAVQLSLSGDFEMPPGGIVVRSPLPRAITRVTAMAETSLLSKRRARDSIAAPRA